MQLNISTDYAIRTVLYLATTGDMRNTSDISETMKIPKDYIVVLTRALRDAGILTTVRGKYGGYTLNKDPRDISLYDIISLMEGSVKLNRCLEEDHYCSRNACDTCPVRKNYEVLQDSVENQLKNVTIASLMGN